ncbi:MAG: cell division protein DivIVA [Bacteroidetes bacterium QS_8_68_28]|nr:MAG: cell division protein DivIVA [Bacteroidetes bacterium QS_8_68_28]
MKLSPMDIRKQEFDSALRGYSTDDVEAFLQMVSEQWEELLDEQRRLEEQVRSLQDKLEHYEEVEEALQEALRTARENSEQKIENAEKKAALMVQEAETRADEIKREAREDREVLRRQVDQLQERRDKTVAGLRAFLMSEMELLLRFDGEDPEALRQSLPDELAQHVSGSETRSEDPAEEAPAPAAEPEETPAPPRADPEEEAEGRPATQAPRQGNAGEGPPPDLPVTEDFDETETFRDTDNARQTAAPEEAPPEETPPEETPPAAASEREEAAEDAGELNEFLKQFEAGQARERDTSEQTPEEDASSEADAEPEPLDAPVNEVLSSREDRNASTGDASGSLASGSPEEQTEGDLTATADEIDKIRRILNDME